MNLIDEDEVKKFEQSVKLGKININSFNKSNKKDVPASNQGDLMSDFKLRKIEETIKKEKDEKLISGELKLQVTFTSLIIG